MGTSENLACGPARGPIDCSRDHSTKYSMAPSETSLNGLAGASPPQLSANTGVAVIAGSTSGGMIVGSVCGLDGVAGCGSTAGGSSGGSTVMGASAGGAAAASSTGDSDATGGSTFVGSGAGMTSTPASVASVFHTDSSDN